jgi:hypothetical protein
MTSLEQFEYQDATKQVDAIFAFEGFEPTEQRRAISAAVMAGRVTHDQAAKELKGYIIEHKTMEGFMLSRAWA